MNGIQMWKALENDGFKGGNMMLAIYDTNGSLKDMMLGKITGFECHEEFDPDIIKVSESVGYSRVAPVGFEPISLPVELFNEPQDMCLEVQETLDGGRIVIDWYSGRVQDWLTGQLCFLNCDDCHINALCDYCADYREL